MTNLKKISAIACLSLAAFLICRTASAQETKTFIAYSMKVAQARVEDAMRKGEDFRKKQPELFYLGGITRPWAVVLDTENNDWILVGERDPKSSVLTLDDWVVALRARFIYPDKDPGVTIDPRPCETCLKAGKKEDCSHVIKQDVRFFGGIEDTHFGQVCYEADWLMKRIGLSLEKQPVKNIKSYFELSVEQACNSGASSTKVSSRFWFYPIINQVNVIEDVVLLEKFQMGVFTEVLYAEIDGKTIADVDKYEHYPSEGFSRSFSENYDAAAQARDVLETLRGLARLSALAKGLTHVDNKSKVAFYLTGYPFVKTKTLHDVEVLKVENQEVGFKIFGGVKLMALTVPLKGGNANELKELVLTGRKVAGANILTWYFETQIQNGQLLGVIMPKDLVDPNQIAPLFQQADFLYEKKCYDAAIECYNKILELNPKDAEAYNNCGLIYYTKREYKLAFRDFEKALKINPNLAKAYVNRGAVNFNIGQYDKAIEDCNKAIELNPFLFQAYTNRANSYDNKGQYKLAIDNYNKALEIEPKDYLTYYNRGIAYRNAGEYDFAIGDFNKTLELNPIFCNAYIARSIIYFDKGQYENIIEDCNNVISIDPKYADAYINRGCALGEIENYEYAINDFDMAIEINPKLANAYLGKAKSLAKLGRNKESAIAYGLYIKYSN